jgi:hypothetical protein
MTTTEAEAAGSIVKDLFRYQHLASRSGRLVVVVLREPMRPGELLCDGSPLVATRPTRCGAPLVPIPRGDVRPSDRFIDPESGLMLGCPQGGAGLLTFEGRRLLLQAAPATP